MTLEASPGSTARRRWACKTLGLSQGAPEQARFELFDQLAAVRFVPSRAGWDAVNMLARDAAPTAELHNSCYVLDFEQRLLRAVENLARRWFRISPVARRGLWKRLRAAAESSPLAERRLAELRPGLDLPCELPPLPAAAGVLLKYLRHLFVVPSAFRTRLRRKLCARLTFANGRGRKKAVEFLRRRFPEWCPLDEAFLEQVAETAAVVPAATRDRDGWLLYLAITIPVLIIFLKSFRAKDADFRPIPQRPTVPVTAQLIPARIRELISREPDLSRPERQEVARFFVQTLQADGKEEAKAALIATLILSGFTADERAAAQRILKHVLENNEHIGANLLGPASTTESAKASMEPGSQERRP